MVGLKGSNVSQLVPRGEDGQPLQTTSVEVDVEAKPVEAGTLDVMKTDLAGDSESPLKSNANEAASQKNLSAAPDKSDIAEGVRKPKGSAVPKTGKAADEAKVAAEEVKVAAEEVKVVSDESKTAKVAESAKDLGQESEIKDPAAKRSELTQKPAAAKTGDLQATAQTTAGQNQTDKTPDHESVAVDKSDEAAAVVQGRTAAVEPSASTLTKEDMRVQKRRIKPRTPARLATDNGQENSSTADTSEAVVDHPLGPAEAGESNIPRRTSPAVVRREDPPLTNAMRDTTGARAPATAAAATNPARRAVDMPRKAATTAQPMRRPTPRRTEPAPRRNPAAIAETNVPRTSPRPSANRPANRTPATPVDSTVRPPRPQAPAERTPRVVGTPSRSAVTSRPQTSRPQASRPQYRPQTTRSTPSQLSRRANPVARPQVEQIPVGDPEVIRVQPARRAEPVRPVSAANDARADRDDKEREDKEREEAVQEIENELQRLQRALQELQRSQPNPGSQRPR